MIAVVDDDAEDKEDAKEEGEEEEEGPRTPEAVAKLSISPRSMTGSVGLRDG